MAAIAGLGILVDDVIQFLAVSGVADASFPVKHPHSHHTRLIGYGAHHVVEAVAIVAQHVVRRAAFDQIADSLCAGKGGCLQVLPV